MEPLLHGDYPKIMKENAGARIPAFTSRESKQVKGSYDFIGIIHYSKFNGTDIPDALKTELRDFSIDSGALLLGMCCIMFKRSEFQRLRRYKLAVLIAFVSSVSL
jgi:beta-glucosidase